MPLRLFINSISLLCLLLCFDECCYLTHFLFSVCCIAFILLLLLLGHAIYLYIYIYILMYTSLLTPHFDEGFGMLPMSFERQKAMRNEELFLFDLIHQYCIWAMEK